MTYHEFFAGHLDERKDGSALLIKKNEENLGLYDGVFALYKVNLTDEEKAKVLGKTIEELSQMSPSDIQKEISKKELSVSDIDIENHFDLENGTPKIKANSEQTIDTAVDQNMKTNADVTTRGATKTISGLEWGLYYFYEVKAPAGYKADSTPHVFAVNSRSVDTLIEVNATDAKVYGEVWLYKQAKEKIENTNDHLKLFGEYLIEEIPVSRYVCTGLELVDGTRNNPNDKFKSVGLTTPTSYLIPESVRLIAGNERKTARIQAYYNTNPLRNQYNNKKLKTAKKAV